MIQKDFETRRATQIRALKSMDEKPRAAPIRALKSMDKKPMIKVIDLVEMLLRENPSLPAIIQAGTHRLPVRYVRADINSVWIII